MKKVFFLAIAIISLASCSPKTTETVEKVESTEFPSTDVAEGSSLYSMHCGKCHGLKTETDYTQDQWKKIVPNMAGKAKIDASQESKVLKYVLWKTEQ